MTFNLPWILESRIMLSTFSCTWVAKNDSTFFVAGLFARRSPSTVKSRYFSKLNMRNRSHLRFKKCVSEKRRLFIAFKSSSRPPVIASTCLSVLAWSTMAKISPFCLISSLIFSYLDSIRAFSALSILLLSGSQPTRPCSGFMYGRE